MMERARWRDRKGRGRAGWGEATVGAVTGTVVETEVRGGRGEYSRVAARRAPTCPRGAAVERPTRPEPVPRRKKERGSSKAGGGGVRESCCGTRESETDRR